MDFCWFFMFFERFLMFLMFLMFGVFECWRHGLPCPFSSSWPAERAVVVWQPLSMSSSFDSQWWHGLHTCSSSSGPVRRAVGLATPAHFPISSSKVGPFNSQWWHGLPCPFSSSWPAERAVVVWQPLPMSSARVLLSPVVAWAAICFLLWGPFDGQWWAWQPRPISSSKARSMGRWHGNPCLFSSSARAMSS